MIEFKFAKENGIDVVEYADGLRRPASDVELKLGSDVLRVLMAANRLALCVRETLKGNRNQKFEREVLDAYRQLSITAEAPTVTAEEREWLQYAIDHMRDDSKPEDVTCANTLEAMLGRLAVEKAAVTTGQDFGYVAEMGDAAEKYHASFPLAHPLPARWRWQELWDRMASHVGAAAAQEAAAWMTHHAAPEGFVMVPVEATVEMVGAGGRAQGETLTWGAVRACWRAMIAARPQGVK